MVLRVTRLTGLNETDDKRKETQIRRTDSRKCEKMSPDDKTFCLKSAGVRQRRRAGRFPDPHQAPAASPSRLTTHTWWAVQDTHTYMPILPLVDCHTTPTKCGLVFWLKKTKQRKITFDVFQHNITANACFNFWFYNDDFCSGTFCNFHLMGVSYLLFI